MGKTNNELNRKNKVMQRDLAERLRKEKREKLKLNDKK